MKYAIYTLLAIIVLGLILGVLGLIVVTMPIWILPLTIYLVTDRICEYKTKKKKPKKDGSFVGEVIEMISDAAKEKK
jgi:hypothetical protein